MVRASARVRLAAALAILVATAVTFWPLLGNGFVNFDDDVYVTDNPHVQAGLTIGGIAWASTATRASNWHPLTWISHMLDQQVYGSAPAGHHLSSLLLHIACALLVFVLFDRTTGAVGRSAFVAALFALHPLRVESVAWIAERKEVLCAFFWLLALIAWTRYVERPGTVRYAQVIVAQVMALASKPMAVTLPLTLLLLDLWPLGRWTREGSSTGSRRSIRALVLEKVPFLIVAAASAVTTLLAQARGGAVGSSEVYPLGVRLANAIFSYAAYLWSTLCPRGLAVFYPHRGAALAGWQVVAAGLAIVALTALAFAARRRRPYLLAGWLWYLVTLLPVIGLVQVGTQGMADRYTYVPLIGIFSIVAWGVPDAFRPAGPTAGSRLAWPAAAVLILLAVTSHFQARTWRDSATLFRHALEVTENNAVAHNNLGVALAASGETKRAIAHYRDAIRIDPLHRKAHNNLGVALAALGRIDEARLHYERATEIDPAYPEAHYNLGVSLAEQGRLGEAVSRYRVALALRPGYAQAHNNLGIALARLERLDEAVTHFARAVELKPGNARAHLNWGLALSARSLWSEAEAHFREAAGGDPLSGEAHFNLGVALFFQGRRAEAREEVALAEKLGFEPPRSIVDALSPTQSDATGTADREGP